jgi:hypothetical protein
MVSENVILKQWFKMLKVDGPTHVPCWIEKIFKKSLTHYMHCVNKIKGYFNFHINNLKLLKD